MKMHFRGYLFIHRKTWAVPAMIFILSSHVFAQGTLRGIVTDSLTTKPLVGANVYLVGTSLGSVTDLEGAYRIERIPEGTYTLRISYIGYRTKTMQVGVQSHKTAVLNVQVTSEAVKGQTVIVRGQAVGQAAAINQQINANTIVNVVSEEKIRELPDANAAEAVGRLPGVAVQRSGGEANKVILRGLSDKFSSITVDNVRIAPTDADSRGVDLSTISPGSLAGIELYKALTPDKDADAIAGSVNLVTKKAPAKRMLQLDTKGAYNKLKNTYNQYDFALRYGERFFNNILGVQLSGNLEQRDRSSENDTLAYNLTGLSSGLDYEITNFTLNFTDEVRKRNGISLLLDIATPDGGTIKINNIYNKTKRDFIRYDRNYPTDGGLLSYGARDRVQNISTYNSSVIGENSFLGLNTTWGISYAQSDGDYPFDYNVSFTEPSSIDSKGNPVSGMANIPSTLKKGPPELLLPYALNNFEKASFYTAYFRGEKNMDKEKTGFLNVSRKYALSNTFSGEFKIGGKYRSKSRYRSRSELLSPYYLEPYPVYTKSPDGTVIQKIFSGTRFADLKTAGNVILVTNFLDTPPKSRRIFDLYDLYPILNRDALHEWWDINKNGYTDSQGKDPEYERDLEADAYYYNIAERISSGYAMNTFNIGQKATLITGIRAENENNDYDSRYSPSTLSGFPTPKGAIRDTTAVHHETVWLPNFHLTYRPFGFMNIRLAAYKALARPDFNLRLQSFVSRMRSTFYAGNSLFVGNPNLKAAKAWNFEANTQLFNNKIGLFSVSAFYKDIKDMYHIVNGVQISGQKVLDSLGIAWKDPFGGMEFGLTYPYNSSKPTRVWGFEVEQQTHFRFLPGLLKNIVLSYNLSIVRSETYITSSKIVRYFVTIPGFPFPIEKSRAELIQMKEKLEGQPEFFGNVALGYDIGGFSARVSIFFQDQYNQSFSATGRNDYVVDRFTKVDLALKQQISEHLSILLNVNNLTNVKEETSILNKITGWDLLNTSERYGMSADIGLRISL